MPARRTSTPVSSIASGREALAPALALGVTLTSTSTTAESAPKGAGVSALAKRSRRVIRATTGVAGRLEAVAFAPRGVPILTLRHRTRRADGLSTATLR
eukprot:4074692-Pleurochrysis_carterae.AAC.1